MMWRRRQMPNVGKRRLYMGARVEKREHNVSWSTARRIASDHLREDPNYYKRLKRCGI